MEPMSSPEHPRPRPRADTLLSIARASIESGLREGRPLEVDPQRYDPELRALRATFVTIRIKGALRGCTGTLEAVKPLVVDVAVNAHRSAFKDPRFPPCSEIEVPELDIHISILSRLEPFSAESEQSLLAALRPGIDGLVLREGAKGGTFLPAVWNSLPSPKQFLDELKRKAGLPADYWSDTLTFQRYTAEEIP